MTDCTDSFQDSASFGRMVTDISEEQSDSEVPQLPSREMSASSEKISRSASCEIERALSAASITSTTSQPSSLRRAATAMQDIGHAEIERCEAFAIPHAEIICGKVLGTGGCGDVRLGVWRGEEVAIKMIQTSVGIDSKEVRAPAALP
ncbi:MAG: hypothetical protein ACPIOQ_75910 [Promethearchaeia archaeon]